MTLKRLPFALVVASAMGLMIPGVVLAQQRGDRAQQVENVQATTTLRGRIATTEDRVKEAQATRKISLARATTLQRQVAVTRQSMTRLGKQQGFVSAAELASYNRALDTIDTELDRRGVARSYGNDMLPAAPHARH